MDIVLDKFIPEVVAMVEKKASVANVSIVQDLSEDPLIIHGEPSELQQVLLNLLNNALYAIEDQNAGSPGEIVLKTRGIENDAVLIEVSDNGSGISPENLKKIFSPFFTTKPVGKGTGLGLSVCFGIIDKMGGLMAVDSQKGKGTTFTIRLPRV
jgi:two-component system NtrC family sensor kinase